MVKRMIERICTSLHFPDWLTNFVLYGFVGGVAFIVDYGAMFLLVQGQCNKYIAVAIAFILGLIVNFVLSKQMVFTQDSEKCNKCGEFVTYAIIGITGLGLTEGIMWVCISILSITYLLGKIIAAALVLIWNYVMRKIILY